MEIIQEIWEDYKKLIVVGVIIALIIGMIIFSAIYDPIKISFTGDDADVIATMKNQIKIGAVAEKKSGKKFDIDWQVSDGSLNANKGNDVVWELPKKEGTYTITVTSNGKTKSKNITLLENQLGELSLQNNDNIEYIDKDDFSFS